jgi:hypothetical protein
MRIQYYVIESDKAPSLRWSNEDGWIKGDDFTRFSESERVMCDLPSGGHWLLVDEHLC